MRVLISGISGVPHEVTFGGRLLKNTPKPIESQYPIRLRCKSLEQCQLSTRSFEASYPEEEKFICGFITWLSFRHKLKGSILKEICFDLDDSPEAIENACKIVSAASISSRCSLVLPEHESPPSNVADNYQNLLSFATLVKEQGNRRFRGGDLHGAKDLYQSELMATLEWEGVMFSLVHYSCWLRLCLDISSNILQTYIRAGEFESVDETVKNVIKLANFDCIEDSKRAKAIQRVIKIMKERPSIRALVLETAISEFIDSCLPLRGIIRKSGSLKSLTFREPREHEPTCSICLETVALNQDGKVPTLGCWHCFHQECITLWFVEQKTCSVCRRGWSE